MTLHHINIGVKGYHLSLCENGRRSGTGYLSHGGCGRGFLYLHRSHRVCGREFLYLRLNHGVWTGVPLLAEEFWCIIYVIGGMLVCKKISQFISFTFKLYYLSSFEEGIDIYILLK